MRQKRGAGYVTGTATVTAVLRARDTAIQASNGNPPPSVSTEMRVQ